MELPEQVQIHCNKQRLGAGGIDGVAKKKNMPSQMIALQTLKEPPNQCIGARNVISLTVDLPSSRRQVLAGS